MAKKTTVTPNTNTTKVTTSTSKNTTTPKTPKAVKEAANTASTADTNTTKTTETTKTTAKGRKPKAPTMSATPVADSIPDMGAKAVDKKQGRKAAVINTKSLEENKAVVLASLKAAKDANDPAYNAYAKEALRRKSMTPVDMLKEIEGEKADGGYTTTLSAEEFNTIINKRISETNIPNKHLSYSQAIDTAALNMPTGVPSTVLGEEINAPNKYLSYNEYLADKKVKRPDRVNTHFSDIMERMLVTDRETKYYTDADGFGVNRYSETVPSDKFVTIANMVKYIQCKLDECNYYIGLSKIDCIVLLENGKLLLYTVSEKGTIESNFSPIPISKQCYFASFRVETIAPIIYDEEIVCYDKGWTSNITYRLDETFDPNESVVYKDLDLITNSFKDSNDVKSYKTDLSILAYWTDHSSERLYPIDVINKTLEGKPYPIIFASECFIER